MEVGPASTPLAVFTTVSETSGGRLAAQAVWTPPAPAPEGIIVSQMTAALSARRRALLALLCVGKRGYIAPTGPRAGDVPDGERDGGEGESCLRSTFRDID